MYTPSYSPPPFETPDELARAEQQEQNLYPPGFEPPPDIKRTKKKKLSRDTFAPPVDAPPLSQPASPPVESLLPPGAAMPSSYAPENYPPSAPVPAPAPHIDAMLPPGTTPVPLAPPPPGAPLRPVVVTSTTDAGYSPSSSTLTGETIVIPTEDGELVAVHERAKTVGKPGQEIELRRRTPEEKARRRLVKNLVMGGFCLIVLAVTFFLLKNMR